MQSKRRFTDNLKKNETFIEYHHPFKYPFNKSEIIFLIGTFVIVITMVVLGVVMLTVNTGPSTKLGSNLVFTTPAPNPENSQQAQELLGTRTQRLLKKNLENPL